MKGSGWVALGLLVIFIFFMMLRLFYQDAMGYRLRHQSVVFGELDVLRVKNMLDLSEKSLFVTWKLSVAREIFDAGASGFSNEYWYRLNPSDRLQTGKIPSDDNVKAFLESGLKTFRGLGGTEKLDDVSLSIDVAPVFRLENARFTARVSGMLKTYIGKEENPSTQSQKSVDYMYGFDIRFRDLIDSGKTFIDRIKTLSLPYSGTAAAYIENMKSLLINAFSGSAKNGINGKELKLEKAELLVPTENEKGVLTPQGGLVFHYDVSARFEEDTKPENQYYYLGENVYEKRPFPLTVKAEDYLVALDCAANNGRLFTYASANDMACDGGKIYACNTNIQGIDGNLRACGGSAGVYGCGEAGFKDANAVDDSPCYCAAFKGNWVSPVIDCSTTTCVPLYDKDGKETGEEDCTTVDYKYACRSECDLNSVSCSCP